MGWWVGESTVCTTHGTLETPQVDTRLSQPGQSLQSTQQSLRGQQSTSKQGRKRKAESRSGKLMRCGQTHPSRNVGCKLRTCLKTYFSPSPRCGRGAKVRGFEKTLEVLRYALRTCLKTYLVPFPHRGKGCEGKEGENYTEVLRHTLTNYPYIRWHRLAIASVIASLVCLPGCGPAVPNEELGTVVIGVPKVPGGERPYRLPSPKKAASKDNASADQQSEEETTASEAASHSEAHSQPPAEAAPPGSSDR